MLDYTPWHECEPEHREKKARNLLIGLADSYGLGEGASASSVLPAKRRNTRGFPETKPFRRMKKTCLPLPPPESAGRRPGCRTANSDAGGHDGKKSGA